MKKLVTTLVLALAIAATVVLSGCSPSYDEHVANDDTCKILIVAKDWDPDRAPCYIVETTNRTDQRIWFKCKDDTVTVAGEEITIKLRENLIEPGKTSTQYMSFPVEKFETPADVDQMYMTFECYSEDGELLGSYPFQDPKAEEGDSEGDTEGDTEEESSEDK